MDGKTNNVIRIPCSLTSSFFKYWFSFLKPFHNLTNREIEVIAGFVKQRYLLSKVIKDEDILDKMVFDEDTKKKVMKDCNIPLSYFQVVISKLRKNKIIINNKINPKFIPNIEDGSNNFKLLLLFDIKDEE